MQPGAIEIAPDGVDAVGVAYVSQIGRFLDGRSQLNYARYDDTYLRTSQGWRSAGRTYTFLYVDSQDLMGTSLVGP